MSFLNSESCTDKQTLIKFEDRLERAVAKSRQAQEIIPSSTCQTTRRHIVYAVQKVPMTSFFFSFLGFYETRM